MIFHIFPYLFAKGFCQQLFKILRKKCDSLNSGMHSRTNPEMCCYLIAPQGEFSIEKTGKQV